MPLHWHDFVHQRTIKRATVLNDRGCRSYRIFINQYHRKQFLTFTFAAKFDR